MSNGRCSACLATFQIHLSDGFIHRHRSRKNPRPGSYQPPLSQSNQEFSACSSLSDDFLRIAVADVSEHAVVSSLRRTSYTLRIQRVSMLMTEIVLVIQCYVDQY